MTWQSQQQRLDHPIVCITLHQARSYAAWLASVTGQSWRLPTEAEWEKAARGTDGRGYPWGNQWEDDKANTADGGPKTTTPVGMYAPKDDVSPYGAHDMAGNVWEWTSTIYREKPPYRGDLVEKDADTTSSRVFRGGSWRDTHRGTRPAYRGSNVPSIINTSIGVRLVSDTGGGRG